MAPIANDPELSSQSTAGAGAKQQPAAVEIPVTVNGARTIEGSAKREPFSETTQTVLVFGNGAVIRLNSPVAPGQLLFLTNEKSKKEVVCQVVKSKNDRSVSGYVELEFTEAAPGFWGMRVAPSAPSANSSNAPKPVAISAQPTKSLEEKLAEVKAIAPATPAANTPKPAANLAAAIPDPAPVKASEQPKEIKAAPIVPAQPPANASKIPSLSEFLTQGANGAELKVPEKAKPNQAKISPAPPNPAPGASTFDFAADEVKIPSWLEPLARNSAPVAESKSAESKPVETSSTENQAEFLPGFIAETKNAAEAAASSTAALGADAHNSDSQASTSGSGPTPNFGLSLPMDRASASSEGAPKRSRKWSIFGLFGSGILLAAGGGWYWYSQQATNVSANGNRAPAQNDFAVSTPANSPADNNFPAAEPVNPAPANDRASMAQNRSLAAPPVALATNHPAAASASNASKTFAPLENAAQQALAAAEPAAEPVKKPTFGAVHLAAPVQHHRSATDSNTTADVAPSLGSNTISPGDAGGLNLLASKGSQPTAPVPVGGDVKQARLISSVPPMYPTLARNQRLSGNVVIDALIDATGRVSTMKVISGPALLHQTAMDAVRQWKYQPATLNGQPMAMHLTVTVQFKLQ